MHVALHHLVPVGTLGEENVLGVVNDLEKLVSVVVAEGESISDLLVLVVRLYSVLKTPRLANNGH